MPGLIVDKVGGGNGSSSSAPKEINFLELNTLKDESKLVVGSEYLLTDYLHKYFIEGSDSAGKKTMYYMGSNVSGWGVVGYNYNLINGTVVTITELPDWYDGAIQVGDTTTVTANSSFYYFMFANGLHWVQGAIFTTATDRYINIAKDLEVNDANGRPVIRPGGIINLEVHDGAAYMEMTAEENKVVVPEQLILIADSVNSFSVEAKSATYPGDIVDYYYDDYNGIYNDNNELIGTRNGFIFKRSNERLNVSLGVDWRNQRYRRWCLDLDSRTKFINQHLDVNTTRIGYQGKNLFTSASRTKEQLDPFYIGLLPEGQLMCLDENAMKTEFLFGAEGIAIAKDFPVFPLDENLDPVRVDQCKIEFLRNTVFQIRDTTDQGDYLSLDAYAAYDSTFYSTVVCSSQKTKIYLNTVIALDFLNVSALKLDFDHCNMLSFTQIKDTTNSMFENCIFASMQNGVRIDGYNLLPVVWWLFVTSQDTISFNSVFSGVMPYIYLENSKIVNSSFFFYHSFNDPGHPNDGDFRREVIKISSSIISNVGFRVTGLCDRIFLNDMMFSDRNVNRVNGLYLYDYPTSLYNKNLKKNDASDALYYENIDADYNRTFIELSAQAENPIDLTVAIVVDDAAPIVGNNVIFTITASNNLGNAATNVIVNSLLPDGYTYVSDDADGGYDSGTGIWSVGGLAISASDVINITATVEETGSYQVDSTIASNEIETAPGDNAASATTTPVAAINDLSTTIDVDNADPTVGNNVIFTISGNNNGNKPATNVQATSLLPVGYTYVSDDAAGGYVPGTGIWTIGNLAIGASYIINITATVEAAGPYQVDVSIDGFESEDMPVDNTDTITPMPVV
jgi:uncharacterized repeat protein (TIGR01451 family)